MKSWSLFFALLLSIVFSLSYQGSYSSEENSTFNKSKEQLIASTSPCDSTYEIVLRDGLLWVIVYDCDGKIIDEYPLL